MGKEKKLKDLYPQSKEATVVSEAFRKKWSRIINKKPSQLKINELSLCLRQQHFVSTLLPLAIEILQIDPLAGKTYKGELLHSVALVTSYDFDSAAKLKTIVNGLNVQACLDRLSSEVEISNFSRAVKTIKEKTKNIQ